MGVDGALAVRFVEAGLYLLESEVEREAEGDDVDVESYSLFATLEVQLE